MTLYELADISTENTCFSVLVVLYFLCNQASDKGVLLMSILAVTSGLLEYLTGD